MGRREGCRGCDIARPDPIFDLDEKKYCSSIKYKLEPIMKYYNIEDNG
jgi:hypothetical protein